MPNNIFLKEATRPKADGKCALKIMLHFSIKRVSYLFLCLSVRVPLSALECESNGCL